MKPAAEHRSANNKVGDDELWSSASISCGHSPRVRPPLVWQARAARLQDFLACRLADSARRATRIALEASETCSSRASILPDLSCKARLDPGAAKNWAGPTACACLPACRLNGGKWPSLWQRRPLRAPVRAACRQTGRHFPGSLGWSSRAAGDNQMSGLIYAHFLFLIIKQFGRQQTGHFVTKKRR